MTALRMGFVMGAHDTTTLLRPGPLAAKVGP
jgi:hypothetical protein